MVCFFISSIWVLVFSFMTLPPDGVVVSPSGSVGAFAALPQRLPPATRTPFGSVILPLKAHYIQDYLSHKLHDLVVGKLCILQRLIPHLAADIFAKGTFRPLPFVPCHKDTPHIVHTQIRALCANGRSLGIVHADEFHPWRPWGSGNGGAPVSLYSGAASSATSFWGTALKAELPVRFRRRILRSCLYSGPRKPQSEKKAAEGVLVVPGVPFLGSDTLLVPGHLAQGADEVVVGLDLFRRGRSGKPGEGDLRLADFDGQFLHPQGFCGSGCSSQP